VRAYEPDGMEPSEFVAFGATQRTLSQFVEAGWKLMGELPVIVYENQKLSVL